MPKPAKGETREQFLTRFMSDPAMVKALPDQKQRSAVAYSYWRKHVNKEPMESTMTPEELQALLDKGISLTADIYLPQEDLEAAAGRPQKFSMVLYSGAPMRPRGFREDVVLDLSKTDIPNTITILADHNNQTDSIVGQGMPVVINNKLTVHGITTEATSGGLRITKLLREQQPLQASVGCDNLKIRRTTKDETINGRLVKAGTLVTTSARLREATVTPCGGDANTNVLAAAHSSHRRNEMTFEEFLASLKFDVAKMKDEEKKKWKATYDALNDEQRTTLVAALGSGASEGGDLNSESVDSFLALLGDLTASRDDDGGDDQSGGATGGADSQTPEEMRAAMLEGFRGDVATERTRIAEIDSLVATFGPQIEDEDHLATLQSTAVRGGWDASRLELELRREARPDPSQFAIHANSGELVPQAVEAAILMASGVVNEAQVGEGYTDEVMNAALSPNYRNYGLKRLCHEVIQAAGMYYAPATYDNGFIHTMLAADSRLNPYSLQAATSMGGIATISVSGILSNVMHKLLLQSFTGDSNGMQVLNQISSVRPVSDFKEHHIYRLTADGTYEQMAPGGNLGYMSLQEEEGKIRAHTYGVMMSLNREMIINDDLNAFAKVPMLIGRQARMKYLRVGYTVFLDDAAFYTTARGNLIESTPFDIDGLTTVVQKFAKILDPNGDPIDTIPRFVVLPSKHQVLGDQVFKDTNIMVWDQDTTATATTPRTTANPHRGKYTPYSTPWIDATQPLVPGGDDDAWYICSGETDMLPLQRAFLNGNQTPRIERIELPADKLGMGWRSYFDFGFARQEWRGSMKVLSGVAALLAAAREKAAAAAASKVKKSAK